MLPLDSIAPLVAPTEGGPDPWQLLTVASTVVATLGTAVAGVTTWTKDRLEIRRLRLELAAMERERGAAPPGGAPPGAGALVLPSAAEREAFGRRGESAEAVQARLRKLQQRSRTLQGLTAGGAAAFLLLVVVRAPLETSLGPPDYGPPATAAPQPQPARADSVDPARAMVVRAEQTSAGPPAEGSFTVAEGGSGEPRGEGAFQVAWPAEPGDEADAHLHYIDASSGAGYIVSVRLSCGAPGGGDAALVYAAYRVEESLPVPIDTLPALEGLLARGGPPGEARLRPEVLRAICALRPGG